MRDLLSIGTSRGCEMIGTGIGLGLSGFRVNPPGALATLDLNFASSLSLTSTSGITPSFSRASTGTYFNASGVLTSAAINGPRFDHVYNGSSWVSKGLLVEEQRTNLLTYSEQMNSGWTNNNINISANSVTAPDGNLTADNLIPDTVNTNHRIYQGPAGSGSAVFSCFAKSTGYGWLQVRVGAGGGTVVLVNFDVINGVVGNVFASAGAASPAQSIIPVGNGWFRCVFSMTGLSIFTTVIMPRNSNATTEGEAFAGNGTDGIAVWGTQLESGVSFPTSYIPTTTAAVTRSADVCQITGGDFSGFYNPSEGSVCFEGDSNGSTAASDIYFLICSDGSTFSNAAPFIFSSGSSNSLRHRLRAGGSDIFNITTSEQLARNTPIKLAQGYKSGDSVILANGSIIDSRTNSFSTASISTFFIGQAFSGSAQINGHIARLRYYNTRLTNSQLQGLTL